jgi:DNA-binding transcriptional regulator YbjK
MRGIELMKKSVSDKNGIVTLVANFMRWIATHERQATMASWRRQSNNEI